MINLKMNDCLVNVFESWVKCDSVVESQHYTKE